MPRTSAIRQQAHQLLRNNPALAHAVAELLEEARNLRGGELVGLTPLQRRLFDFLAAYIEARGVSPSYTEICNKVGVSRSNIGTMLGRLKERGYVSFVRNRARSITILPAAQRFHQSLTSRPERLAA